MYLVAFPNRSPQYYITHKETFHKLGMLRWEDGKEYPLPQDFADMLGWKELAVKVDKAYLQINDPAQTLVLCDNYGQAGAINFIQNTEYTLFPLMLIILTGSIFIKIYSSHPGEKP